MKKIGIFYGSSTGTTEDIANKIATALGVDAGDVHNAADINDDLINGYEALVLGTSTWGVGDLQDDWFDALETLKKLDLSSKSVAIFGCGDSASYSDTFCDGIGIIRNELSGTGCKFCGSVDRGDYDFEASVAEEDGVLVGLAIDEENESDKTDARIDSWVAKLQSEL